MSQFLQGITGPQGLQQTGRSPIGNVAAPTLGESVILETAEAGKALPQRVVILTALAEEFLAVERYVVGRQEIRHDDGTVYEYGQFTRDGVVWDVAIVETGQGNRRAATETQRAIRYFKPDVVLFVGVAGGRKDVKIGDVVAAEKVYNYESGRDEIEFKPRPEAERSSYPLEQRARAIVRDWLRRKQEPGTEDLPDAYVGAIAAGESVVASTQSATAQRLSQNYGDALAVEKEGYGFLGAAREVQNVSALVIRGISDLLDDKENSDKQGSQRLAARHASEFAFELLAKLNGSAESGNSGSGPISASDQIGEFEGDNLNIDLEKKPPTTIAILRFQQNDDAYSLYAHHSEMTTFEETASALTLPKRLGQFGTTHPWSLNTVGDLEDYKPQSCMIGQVLKWLRCLQRQQPLLTCLVIEEPQNSIVPWELLNLKDEPLGVVLQTVRSCPMLDDDEMEEDAQAIRESRCCCQGVALMYAPVAPVEPMSRYFPGEKTYVYESFAHDEPEQILMHLQQVKIPIGLVVMSDLALQQVSSGKRTAYLKRTKLLRTASVVMLQLSVVDDSDVGQREVAAAFVEHGAKGVLGMLENVEGTIVRQIMNDFFIEYERDPGLPIPEIMRRLRVAIMQRLDDRPTDEMSRLYLATFMYGYYGHPMTVLQLTPVSP
jgi:nucleoside phosphorylase